MSIRLFNCNETTIKELLKGDSFLASHLGIAIPQPWSEFGSPMFEYALTQIQADSSSLRWWTYLPILEEENTLVGSCGYKGPPTAEGTVEIGYEVAQDYRNRGLATEMATKLVNQAFESPEVVAVLAHTLAEENASCKVLRKCGFEWVEALHDEEDGDIWKWRLSKPQPS